MAELIPGMSMIEFAPILSQIMYWLGMALLAGLIIGVLWFAWYTTTFKIKATVYPLYGSGKDGIFSIGKPRYEKVKWVNDKTAWRSNKPLFNKEDREPFDSEYIYPGSRIHVFELNNQWFPGRINITQTEEGIRGEVNPVPYVVRNWQSMTHKKHAQEFAKMGFWEENKYMFITMGCIIACCVICGATIWMTYKFATGGTNAMNNLATIMQNMGSRIGAPG